MTPIFAILLTLGIAADEPLAVRATRGQELVYRGQFTEESRGLTVDRRSFDLEARTFILEVGPAGAEVAFQTVLKDKTVSGSARMELATVDARGRITLHLTGNAPLVPLDGPPSLEPAGFVELPSDHVQDWDAADGPRPPRQWRITGEDFSPGVRCVKLVGEQESAEWRRPTGNAPAWRRTEVVWLTVATGMVQRLERTVERRGGSGSAEYSARTEYELKTISTLPDGLAADCRREIQRAGDFRQKLAAILARTRRDESAAQLTALLDKIDRHLQQQSSTPFRPALVALRDRVEAAMRGEAPPPADAPDPPTAPPAVGQTGSDFLTTDLVSGAAMRLARWRGKPVVLLFIRPDSPAVSPTLNLAADLQTRYADRLRVAVLVNSDEDQARPAWAEYHLPLLAGRDVAAMYAVTGPSRVVVLDADGVVRHLGDVGPGVIDAVHRVASGK